MSKINIRDTLDIGYIGNNLPTPSMLTEFESKLTLDGAIGQNVFWGDADSDW